MHQEREEEKSLESSFSIRRFCNNNPTRSKDDFARLTGQDLTPSFHGAGSSRVDVLLANRIGLGVVPVLAEYAQKLVGVFLGPTLGH